MNNRRNTLYCSIPNKGRQEKKKIGCFVFSQTKYGPVKGAQLLGKSSISIIKSLVFHIPEKNKVSSIFHFTFLSPRDYGRLLCGG